MLRQDNFLYTQYKRELGSYKSPVRVQYKILRRLIESDNWNYKKIFDTNSHKKIYYKESIIHLEDYSTIKRFGPHHPVKFRKIQKKKERGRVIDATYSVNLNPCVCRDKKCQCGKKYLYCLTLDQWLLKCNFETGVPIKEIYVNSKHHDFGFTSCNWSGLNDLYVLKSGVDVEVRTEPLLYMAVFNSSLKLMYFFNIERKVFGKDCKDAFLADQLLVTRCRNRFQIYSFEDVIKEGEFVSNLPMRDFAGGFVMAYGLAMNFKINKAPPVLYVVSIDMVVPYLGDSLEFGGYPFHCMFSYDWSFALAKLDKLEENRLVRKFDGVSAKFLPMSSNRIVVQTPVDVHCHEIVPSPDSVIKTKELFTFGFPDHHPSCYADMSLGFPCVSTVFAMAFESSLDLIGILGIHRSDVLGKSFVKLFDSNSGREMKTVSLNKTVHYTSDYSFCIDLDVIVLLEKTYKYEYLIKVYELCSS